MMSNGIRTMTIHAPCVNLVLAMITVAMAVVTAPIPLTRSFFSQWGPFLTSQRFTIPACEMVKERNTPTA